MSPWALVGRAVPNASSELMSLCGAIKHLLAWPGCVGQLIPMEFFWLAKKTQALNLVFPVGYGSVTPAWMLTFKNVSVSSMEEDNSYPS